MSFGLEVYDADNQLVFSSNELTTAYMGIHTCTTRSGSFTVTSGVGTVWATSPMGLGTSYLGMEIWVEGDSVFWQMFFSKVSDSPKIIYGRYS